MKDKFFKTQNRTITIFEDEQPSQSLLAIHTKGKTGYSTIVKGEKNIARFNKWLGKQTK